MQAVETPAQFGRALPPLAAAGDPSSCPGGVALDLAEQRLGVLTLELVDRLPGVGGRPAHRLGLGRHLVETLERALEPVGLGDELLAELLRPAERQSTRRDTQLDAGPLDVGGHLDGRADRIGLALGVAVLVDRDHEQANHHRRKRGDHGG